MTDTVCTEVLGIVLIHSVETAEGSLEACPLQMSKDDALIDLHSFLPKCMKS